MKLGVHLVTYDFEGGPAAIAPMLAATGNAVDVAGIDKALRHGPLLAGGVGRWAGPEHAGGLHDPWLPGSAHDVGRAAATGHRDDIPAPWFAGKDHHHPRRAFRWRGAPGIGAA